MRSLGFAGANLRYAANSLLAIAIALYIIYPTTVVLDSYFIHWLFTPCPAGGINTAACNPDAGYLLVTYSHDNLNNMFSNNAGCSGPSLTLPGGYTFHVLPCGSGFFGFIVQLQNSFSSSLGGLFGIVNSSGDQLVQGVQFMVLSISEFMFIVVLLFAMNIMITLGFAMGLAKALEQGVEGAASFWSAV